MGASMWFLNSNIAQVDQNSEQVSLLEQVADYRESVVVLDQIQTIQEAAVSQNRGGRVEIRKIDFSGPSVARSTTYIADNGIVVTSSAATYPNATNYYIEYLFNGDNSTTSGTTYWLTSSSGNQTLTFDLTNSDISLVQNILVYPRARDDASSNYSITTSSDGSTYTEVVPLVVNSTSSPNYGVAREHLDLGITDPYIRFNLTQNNSYGVILHEIEFYGG